MSTNIRTFRGTEETISSEVQAFIKEVTNAGGEILKVAYSKLVFSPGYIAYRIDGKGYLQLKKKEQ